MAGLFKTPRLRDRPAEAAQRDQATPGGYGRAETPTRVPLPSYRSAATALGAAGGKMPDSRLYTRLSQSPRLAAMAHDAGVQLAQVDSSASAAASDDERAYRFIDEIIDDWEKEDYDPSGPSKYGIKKDILDQWNARYKDTPSMLTSDVRQLKRADARRIMKEFFYDHYRIREIENDRVAHQILDIYVNSATMTLREIIQSAIDQTMRDHNLYNEHEQPFTIVDPVGPKSRARLNWLVEKGYLAELQNALVNHRYAFFKKSGSLEKKPGLVPRIRRFWEWAVPFGQ